MINKFELSMTIQTAAKAAIQESNAADPIALGMDDLWVSRDETRLLVLGMIEAGGTTYFVGTQKEPVRPQG